MKCVCVCVGMDLDVWKRNRNCKKIGDFNVWKSSTVWYVDLVRIKYESVGSVLIGVMTRRTTIKKQNDIEHGTTLDKIFIKECIIIRIGSCCYHCYSFPYPEREKEYVRQLLFG